MFWQIFTIENTKHFWRALLWVELGIFALLVGVLHVVLFITLQLNPGGGALPAEARMAFLDTLTWPGALLNGLSFSGGNSLGGMLLIILVGAVTAQEYAWRTLHLWLSRGIPRSVWLAAKFCALLLPLLLIVLTPLLVGAAVTIPFSLQINGSLRLEQLDSLHLIYSLARTAYTLLPYGAMAFLIAIASRSVVAAIGVALGYSLIIEGIAIQLLGLMGGVAAKIGHYLPAGLASSLLYLNQPGVEVSMGVNIGAQPEFLPPLPAALGLAAWTIIFAGLTFWVFQRQDLAE